MPIQVPVVQTGLEKSIIDAGRKAGKNLKINLGTSAKDIKSLEQPLGRITGKADDFGKSMEAANARVLAFGASVGILNAVVQSFKTLVSTTIEVEKSLTKINSILNATGPQLNTLKQQIFDIAKNTEQTFDIVADAALELSRQGLSAIEVTKRLNDSLILSRLSGLSAAEAVSGLTAAVNSFSKAGLTTGEVLNKISAAANQFAVSERDLIEGFKRSASVAEQAGVSIDELGGIITAVQQRTARGGAVIGNSFKTIFTRIGRAENLELLDSLGVQITDIQGKILPATKLIENLAKTLEDLDQTQVRNVSEKIGGGFQIAPLLAALADYSSETSVAIQATQAFANATNEAYKKNEIQNLTLSAAINKTSLSVKELANALGELGVIDTFKSILDSLNSFAEGVKNVLSGDDLGSTFARGIVKGISGVLLKGGIALFAVIVGKLAIDLAKFGISSLKTFLGLNREAEKLKNIEQQIVSTLLSDKNVRSDILNIEKSSKNIEDARLKQAQYFTGALNEQLLVLKQMQAIASSVAPTLGASVGAARRGGSVRRAAGGYLPIKEEMADISKGVGGAPAGAKPVVIPNFATGGGGVATMVANTSEYFVPNFAGKGSAIFNQDMVKSMGLPEGAKKINAAGGFVPNFAGLSSLNPTGSRFGDLKLLLSKGNTVKGQSQKGFGSLNKEDTNAALAKSRQNAKKDQRVGFFANATVGGGGFIMLTPEQVGYQVDGADKRFDKPRQKNGKSLSFFEGALAGIDKGITSKKTKDGKSFASLINIDEQLTDGLEDGLAKTISNITKTISPELKLGKNISGKSIVGTLEEGGAGAFGALRGAAFEKIMNLVVDGLSDGGSSLDIDFSKDEGNYLDLMFNLPKGRFKKGDFKVSGSKGNKDKYITQVLNSSYTGAVGPANQYSGTDIVGASRVFSPVQKSKKAAGGYIPNFAMSPIEDAIQREKDAGVPVNQIRINQNGRLRNSQNPSGIAVTNTRDEPTGAIPNFASQGSAYSASSNSSSGVEKATGDLTGKFLGLSLVAGIVQSSLSNVAGESDGALKSIANFSSGLVSAISTLALIKTIAPNAKIPGIDRLVSGGGGLGKLGGIFSGLGKNLFKLIPVVGGAIAAFQVVSAAFKAFDIDLFQVIGEKIGFLDSPAEKAAKNLEKLSDAALNNAITTGQFSTKPFEDFLNRIGSLSDEELEGNLSKRGKKALKAGDTNVLTESIKDSIRKSGAEGVIGDLIKEEFTANKQVLKKQTGQFAEFGSRKITGEDLSPLQEKQLRQNIAEGKRAGSGLEDSGISNANFNTSPEKIEALFDAQFTAIQAFADPKTFKAIVDAQKKGDNKKVESLTVDLFGGNIERYEKFIKDVAKINVGTSEGKDALALRVKQETDLLKADQKAIAAKQSIKTIEANISKIRRQSLFDTGQQLTNLKSQVELSNELVIAKKSSTASEKLGAKFQLDSIKSQRKLIQEKSKSTTSLLEGVTGDVVSDVAGNQRVEAEKAFSNLIQEVNSKLASREEINIDNLLSQEKYKVLQQGETKILRETLVQALANNKALDDKSKLQLSINNLTKAQNALNRIAAKDDERAIANLQKRLDFNEKNLSIQQQISNAEAELAKSEIDSGAINGNQFSKFSATQQKAKIDETSIFRNFTLELSKSVGNAAKDALNQAISAGVSPTEDLFKQVGEFQKEGFRDVSVGGAEDDVEGFLQKLNTQSKEAIKAERDLAIEKSITEINNILAFGGYVEAFGSVISSILPQTGQVGNGFAGDNNPLSYNPNIGGSPTGGALLDAPEVRVDERSKSLTDAIKRLSELKGKEIVGEVINVNEILSILSSGAKLAGIELSKATNDLANSVDEAGGSLTTFANLVRNELNGSKERIAQAQFTLGTSADPSAIQSAGFTLGREKVIGETGDIELANRSKIIAEKTFEIQTATEYATQKRLEFELDKTLEILDIRNKINALGKNADPKKKRQLEEEQAQAQKELKKGQDFKSRAEGALFEGSEQTQTKFEDNLISAAKGFKEGIISGLSDAITKGADLKDVLKQAALGFVNKMAEASVDALFNKTVSNIGGAFGFGPLAFASGGMVNQGSGTKDDVPAMLMGGEYVMKKSAVNKYGPQFMEGINSGSLPKFAKGGFVGNYAGGSEQDKIFANTFGQEANFGTQTGEGGYFAPGSYGGTIKGKKGLMDFATQGYTSGLQDVVSSQASEFGGASSISLEPESVRLTNLGRNMGTPLQQATEDAKQQAFGLYQEQVQVEAQVEQQKKDRKKFIKNKLIGAAVSIAMAGLSAGLPSGAEGAAAGAKNAVPAASKGFLGGIKDFGSKLWGGVKGFFTGAERPGFEGAGKIGGILQTGTDKATLGTYLTQTKEGLGFLTSPEGSKWLTDNPKFLKSDYGKNWQSLSSAQQRTPGRRATGGYVQESAGVDTVPTMLSGGEFVLNSAAAERMGQGNLENMNSGGSGDSSSGASGDLIEKLDELIAVTKESTGEINITVNGESQEEEEDSSGQGSSSERSRIAKQLKESVLKIINDEKRLGGSLRGGL